jgi:hypothetical protein
LKRRLFLTCWIVFSLHFATNVVREHYPAFSLIENGDFKLDEYAGFHSDIFEHRDGHHYIGNQVTASVIAAIPLLLFDPILDRLEEVGKRRNAARSEPAGEYETEKPMRREFFRKVQERGLDLRFGAATIVTSVFLMAPLSALFAVLVLGALLRRGVPETRALWLAILFAFGTPIFYRTAVLNHNMFLAIAVFSSFLLLWPQSPGAVPLPARRRFWAGSLAGLGIALDYVGLISLLCLFGYLLLSHGRGRGIAAALRSAPAFVLGSIPPVLFLLWSQWVSYGNPFLPGQLWMPDQNIYVGLGARGFTWPDPEIFLLNLIDLDWGMYAFGPLLLLGLVPARFATRETLILPKAERRFAAVFVLAFMLFCASNQYSRLQWNTGFRYLLPVVPFIFLALSDHLVGMRASRLALISAPVLLHSWVLSMIRYTPTLRGEPQAIPESWCRFLAEGVQFRWLNVIKSTPSLDIALLRSPVFPYLLVTITAVAIFAIWRFPQRKG